MTSICFKTFESHEKFLYRPMWVNCATFCILWNILVGWSWVVSLEVRQSCANIITLRKWSINSNLGKGMHCVAVDKRIKIDHSDARNRPWTLTEWPLIWPESSGFKTLVNPFLQNPGISDSKRNYGCMYETLVMTLRVLVFQSCNSKLSHATLLRMG